MILVVNSSTGIPKLKWQFWQVYSVFKPSLYRLHALENVDNCKWPL